VVLPDQFKPFLTELHRLQAFLSGFARRGISSNEVCFTDLMTDCPGPYSERKDSIIHPSTQFICAPFYIILVYKLNCLTLSLFVNFPIEIVYACLCYCVRDICFMNYRICSCNLRTFFILVAEKSVCVKYADFFVVLIWVLF
jgi:hypothetical protein